MSSNIRISKICEHCNKPFIARTTVTRYCSDNCAKKAYKLRKRNEKIAIKITEEKLPPPHCSTDLRNSTSSKEVFTVLEASVYLGCSKHTIYRLIEDKRIAYSNLGIRKIRILKQSLVDLFG